MQGMCKKGRRCSFAHSHDELRVGITLRKTRMCELYKRGECKNLNCTFAHGEVELRSTPDYYKTALCRFWLRGTCPQGGSCRHAHGEQELRGRTYRHTNTEKTAYLKDRCFSVPGESSHCGQVQPSLVPHVRSNRPIPPPPGLTSATEDLIEVYDGLRGERVLVAAEAYRSPRHCTTPKQTNGAHSEVARLTVPSFTIGTPTTTAPSSPLLPPNSTENFKEPEVESTGTWSAKWTEANNTDSATYLSTLFVPDYPESMSQCNLPQLENLLEPPSTTGSSSFSNGAGLQFLLSNIENDPTYSTGDRSCTRMDGDLTTYLPELARLIFNSDSLNADAST